MNLTLQALESCVPRIVNQLKPSCLPRDQKEAANCVQILAPSHLTAILSFDSGAAKQRLKLLATSKVRAKDVKDAASKALKALEMEEDKVFQQRSQQLLDEEAAEKKATEARDAKMAKAKAAKDAMKIKVVKAKETGELANEDEAILQAVAKAVKSCSLESESPAPSLAIPAPHISTEPMPASSSGTSIHSIPDQSHPATMRARAAPPSMGLSRTLTGAVQPTPLAPPFGPSLAPPQAGVIRPPIFQHLAAAQMAAARPLIVPTASGSVAPSIPLTRPRGLVMPSVGLGEPGAGSSAANRPAGLPASLPLMPAVMPQGLAQVCKKLSYVLLMKVCSCHD